MPKHRGRKDYLGDIADSIGASAVREGDGSDLKTNRAKELKLSLCVDLENPSPESQPAYKVLTYTTHLCTYLTTESINFGI